ncbi:hypothetical protein [Bdellovibrio sp. HCB2-146]|uniref:hypothetical protein n=1 Tax=Bdellovibrio sp. HCB2-146 TaxID=3394362 RepID=UPI0039BD6AFF
MKHKISKLIITLGILATLPACIEVKDKDEEGNVVIQTIEGDDLVVDEPLFLHEGQFLRQDAFQQIRTRSTSPQEYKIKLASLKMGPNGVIYTMGNTVRFDIHSLESMAGVIATFPEGSKAESGKGRSGGAIIIQTANAQGILRIKLIGETGGQGDPGQSPTAAMKGATGATGKNGGNACGVGGIGGSVGGNFNVSGTVGGNGGKGQQGFVGGKGYAGGSSGTLSLTVTNSVNFKPEVEIKPGKGGAGGLGGEGGEGGDGGPGGKKPCAKDKYWPSGAKGPQGDRGPTGPSGSDGVSETACFYVLQNPMCDTKSFSYSK